MYNQCGVQLLVRVSGCVCVQGRRGECVGLIVHRRRFGGGRNCEIYSGKRIGWLVPQITE